MGLQVRNKVHDSTKIKQKSQSNMKDNGKFTSIKASERVTGFPHMINFAGTCCRKWHRTLQLKPPRTSMSLHILAIIMVQIPSSGS